MWHRVSISFVHYPLLAADVTVGAAPAHYAPWVRERQEQAEADVRRTWAQDPVALLEAKGTPDVHGKPASLN
jgi:hypothetical protein